MELSNKQKRDLKEVITNSGINIKHFSEPLLHIAKRHELSDYYEVNFQKKFKYEFWPRQDFFDIMFQRPGSNQEIVKGQNWSQLIYYFREWVISMEDEVEPIDWYGDESKQSLFENPSINDLNSKLSTEEKVKIIESINYIIDKVNELDVPEENRKFIMNKFEELESQIHEATKFQFSTLYYGTISAIATSALIPTDMTGLFAKIITEAFNLLLLK